MILNCLTGSESWQNHAAKLHVFYSPTAPGLTETHLGAAADDSLMEVQKVRATRNEAKPGFRKECGFWTDAIYELAEGSILKIFAYKTGSFGTRRVQANQFIRVRESAPLQRVVLELSQDPNARYRVATVQGKFDLLSFEEAQLLGAKVLPQFKGFSAPEVLRRAFQFDVIEQGTQPRPIFQGREVIVGTTKVQVLTRQRRRVLPS